MKRKHTLTALLLVTALILGFAEANRSEHADIETQQARSPWAGALLLGAVSAGLKTRKRRKELERKIQSAQIRWQLVNNTELDTFRGTYGEFFLRRATNNSKANPTGSGVGSEYTRVAITSIQKDYFYVTDASFPAMYLKEQGDTWAFTHQDGIGIKTVFQIVRLNFSDIDLIHWEANENWDIPQIFCTFGDDGRLPASRVLYAEKVYNGDRFLYRCVCDQKEITGASKKLHQ